MSTPQDSGQEPVGILLHLAGPLQSWGTHSAFNERDTSRFPTRSGIIGLLAAGMGRQRGEPIKDLARLSLTTRTDRPGVLLRDLHTAGGGLPTKATVTTAEGKKRPPGKGTLLSHRAYLADAAFTAVLTCDDAELLHHCAQALTRPVWPPYLGRRACPPETPLLIGVVTNPLHHLIRIPLARSAPTDARDGTSPRVEFHSDAPLHHLPLAPDAAVPDGHLDGSAPVGEVTDDPVDLSPKRRVYRARPLYRRTLRLPATPYGGLGADYLTALQDYLEPLTSREQGDAA
ncbi:type I-E CRISPR-associated protein Cas5/CasD [Streptomyces sp. NPDC058045]|uniref:type I-E CRISPR-associated protein Cas5/CasD n=1 Tax=Streptomyces sp. NPDC058045 TaxID=3346311 RepID=UPI0036E5C432